LIVFLTVFLEYYFIVQSLCNLLVPLVITYLIYLLDLFPRQSNESREVLQFHYTAWPDFGVPESPTAFLDFLLAIRDHNVLNEVDSPAIIHCSAGIGRSGTICLVDTCLVLVCMPKLALLSRLLGYNKVFVHAYLRKKLPLKIVHQINLNILNCYVFGKLWISIVASISVWWKT